MRNNCSKLDENINSSQDDISFTVKMHFANSDQRHGEENLKNLNTRVESVKNELHHSDTASENKKETYKSNIKWKMNQIAFGTRRQQFKPHSSNRFVSVQEKMMEGEDRQPFNRRKKENYKKKLKEVLDFKYGNYHQYYGYRNQGSIDSRLLCMRKEWFYEKDVLDIGCNAGHFTLSVARDFAPRSIIGVDIDTELVKMAKKNIRHYINYDYISDNDFPLSLVLSYGPIAQALDPRCRYTVGKFPFNVQFIQGNYILPFDELLQWQEPFFDAILCLSLTKWIHLNWGDSGVKRLFHRVFAHLRPGGVFILEAQSFQSYAKKKKITEDIFKHYNEIQFFPEMFNEFLVKEVGFQSCELIDTPAHSSKGFSRPIYLFLKANEMTSLHEKKPKHVIYDSDSSCNYSDIEQFSD